MILYIPVFVGSIILPLFCGCLPYDYEGLCYLPALFAGIFIYLPLILVFLLFIIRLKDFLFQKYPKIFTTIIFDIFFCLILYGVLLSPLISSAVHFSLGLWLLRPTLFTIAIFLLLYLVKKYHKRSLDIELALILSGILLILIRLWYLIHCNLHLF